MGILIAVLVSHRCFVITRYNSRTHHLNRLTHEELYNKPSDQDYFQITINSASLINVDLLHSMHWKFSLRNYYFWFINPEEKMCLGLFFLGRLAGCKCKVGRRCWRNISLTSSLRSWGTAIRRKMGCFKSNDKDQVPMCYLFSVF